MKTELFERVKKAGKLFCTSDSGMAAAIGEKQSTFSGYLNKKRQHKLWPLLPRILATFPRLSRHWLYFDEGPMTIGQGVPLGSPVPLQEIARAAEAIAADCGGDWGHVLRMIVGQQKKTSGVISEGEKEELLDVLRENRLLFQENRKLRNEIEKMKSSEPAFDENFTVTSAPGAGCAALLPRQETDNAEADHKKIL